MLGITNLDTEKLLSFMLFFPGFLLSLSVHEAAHGWMASRFGDMTARDQGRVTLNPLPHIDPLGTLVLPLLGFFSGGILIGWGNPVPVDYRNLKNWKKDGLFIASAGPLSNFALALLFAAILHIVVIIRPEWFQPGLFHKEFLIMMAIKQTFFLNLALGFFNLLPINPLDGGKVLYGLLPPSIGNTIDAFTSRFGFILLIALFASGAFHYLVGYPVMTVAKWLL